MNLAEAERVVRDIKYRPGWALSARCAIKPSGVWLEVSLLAEVVDAYDAFQRTQVSMTVEIEDAVLAQWDAARLLHFVFHSLVLEAEHHEAAEFFQYRGGRPFDPHRRHDGLSS